MTHYDRASALAAEICNLHLHSDRPTTETFAAILFLILDALHEAKPEMTPSDN